MQTVDDSAEAPLVPAEHKERGEMVLAAVIMKERKVFDTTQIRRGYFICGRHMSWPEGVNGLVADVRDTELLVQFLPAMCDVTNHYRIRAEEVADGEWQLKISPDLVRIEEVEGDGTGRI